MFKILNLRNAARLRHAEIAREIAQTLRRIAAPAHPHDRRHTGVIPAFHYTLLHKLQQLALAQYGVRQAQPVKLNLPWMEDAELIEIPVIQRTMIFKLKRADRVGDALDRIRLTVRPVVHRINAPLTARAVMLGVQDAVHHRIPHIEIRRGHVDLRS